MTGDGFRGWGVDLVQWDELDRIDPERLAEVFGLLASERGYHVVSFDLGRPEPLPLSPPDIREPLFISGFVPDLVGRYVETPNRRRFKRNARKNK